MKEIGKIKLYDSIDNLPQIRKHLFDQLMIMHSGIGGGIKGIESSFQKMDSLIRAKKLDKLIIERQNIHFRFLNSLSGTNFKSLAFICLVKEVEGVQVNIEREEDAEALQKQVLSKVSHKELNNFIEEVKKNYFSNLGYISQSYMESQRN